MKKENRKEVEFARDLKAYPEEVLANFDLAPIKKGPRGIFKYNSRVGKKMRKVVLTALHSDLRKRFKSVLQLKEALTNV